eukprot:GDKJ01017322.1.p1 GENE.GDKJ01017322.1~~GDKJ01017322.1.p1  ORF type:complete len:442 (-),score=96.81 GDKJ01017322.1:703-2028(-)
MGNCASSDYGIDFHRDFSMGKEIGRGGYGVVRIASTKKSVRARGYPNHVAVKVITLDTADKRPEEELKKKIESMRKLLQDPNLEENEEKVFLRQSLRELEKTHRQCVRRSALEEVENEVHLLKAFDHPCLPKLRNSFRDRERVLVVIDYYKGGCLQPKLEAETTFPFDVVATIIRDVLEALRCVHAMKIIHRDVKLSNILLTDPDLNKTNAVLADFGLATLLPEENSTVMEYCGTESFMAPEVKLGLPYSYSCDMYAVGICLYWMIFGEHPMISVRSRQNVMVAKLLQEKEKERRASFKGDPAAFNDPGPSDEEIRECLNITHATMSTDPAFVSVWNQQLVVEESLMDLIRQLLQLHPRLRMTAAEALSHPWIVAHARPMSLEDSSKKPAALLTPLAMHNKFCDRSNISSSSVDTENRNEMPLRTNHAAQKLKNRGESMAN